VQAAIRKTAETKRALMPADHRNGTAAGETVQLCLRPVH